VFIVSGYMQFDAARRDDVAAAMRAVAGPSVEEDGCLGYAFSEDVAAPGRFRIFEHWASDEAFGTHCQSAHYLAFMEQLGGLGMTGADVSRYEVSSVTSLAGG
jgi:quinol monooxygenase YgiN